MICWQDFKIYNAIFVFCYKDIFPEKHAIDHRSVLLKQAANKQELTNWENILITKNEDGIINFEILPTDHLTKKFFLNRVEDSRSAPIRIPNQHQSVMG